MKNVYSRFAALASCMSEDELAHIMAEFFDKSHLFEFVNKKLCDQDKESIIRSIETPEYLQKKIDEINYAIINIEDRIKHTTDERELHNKNALLRINLAARKLYESYLLEHLQENVL